MAKENNIEELYAIASNPKSEPKDLIWVWNQTKSPRVRKAIASNTNSDSEVLAMAARLYVKEVLNNPSLELVNLFCEDEFIKEIYEAYTDPKRYFSSKSIFQSKFKENICKAITVSPNLKNIEVLRSVAFSIKQSDFARELKDPQVRKNIHGVIKSNLSRINLPLLILFMKSGAIDITDFDNSLERRIPNSKFSNWISRGDYHRFFRQFSKSHATYKTLLNFIFTTPPNNAKDLIEVIKTDEEASTDEMLDLYSCLYKDSLYIDVKLRRNLGKQLYFNNYKVSLLDESHSRFIYELLCNAIFVRNEDKIKSFDFKSIYRDLSRAGFVEEMGPFGYPLRFTYTDVFTKCIIISRLLELDDEALEFFLTSGMLNTMWIITGDSSSPEYKLISRIDSINEKKFLSGEPLLYSQSCFEGMTRCIFITTRGEFKSTKGKFTVPATGTINSSLPLPDISGRADIELLDKISSIGRNIY